MVHTIKLTSKRQATLPVKVCKDLGVQAGDEIILEKQKVEGDVIWILRPRSRSYPRWFGRLREYAQGKNHDMEAIRSSVGFSIGFKK